MIEEIAKLAIQYSDGAISDEELASKVGKVVLDHMESLGFRLVEINNPLGD